MAPGQDRGRRRRLAGIGLLIIAAIGFAAVFTIERAGVAPRLAGLFVERRSRGHFSAIEAPGRWIAAALIRLDRGTRLPLHHLPSWFGARTSREPEVSPSRTVTSPDQLRDAVARAIPGDTILLLPGTYRFVGSSLAAATAGRKEAPITVRARQLGEVTLEFDILEGFRVSGPYWTFENLVVRGVCPQHDDCEHAFHVVGEARGVVIRNNDLRDFNSQIKINGEDGVFPDGGRILGNTLANSSPRHTGNPVTPVDLVAANDWVIEDNLIADFVKADTDDTSYGGFAKGAGRGNQFLRNVVLCEHRLRGSPGRRVGLSFGGGGSYGAACRDGRCDVEHQNGTIAGNLIVSCSDVGIYVNNSDGSRLSHNTLLDTAGIHVRFPLGSAVAEGNLVDGPIRNTDGARITDSDNMATMTAALFAGYHPVRNRFVDAPSLDLRWRQGTPRRNGSREPVKDLCGSHGKAQPAYGAFENFEDCSGAR